MHSSRAKSMMNVADFCEMARWTPAEHAAIGLADAQDALLAIRAGLSAQIDTVSPDSKLCADLRRIFRRVHLAAEAAGKRFEMAYP